MVHVDAGNTINICLGYGSFPAENFQYVDVMLSPRSIVGPNCNIVIPTTYFGEHGSSLSEYVQLLWLYDNFETIIRTHEYIRLFHYRRFVSRRELGLPSANWKEVRWIAQSELQSCSEEFSRTSTSELFNKVQTFAGGVVVQYQQSHQLVDFIHFSKFLLESAILDPLHVALFLREQVLIPASSVGVFRSITLRQMLAVLRRAAEFINTDYFVPRRGYQRRVLGFLLERLHSYLLLVRIRSGQSEANFGHHIIISDGPVISSSQ
jgi:hypothetical protein